MEKYCFIAKLDPSRYTQNVNSSASPEQYYTVIYNTIVPAINADVDFFLQKDFNRRFGVNTKVETLFSIRIVQAKTSSFSDSPKFYIGKEIGEMTMGKGVDFDTLNKMSVYIDKMHSQYTSPKNSNVVSFDYLVEYGIREQTLMNALKSSNFAWGNEKTVLGKIRGDVNIDDLTNIVGYGRNGQAFIAAHGMPGAHRDDKILFWENKWFSPQELIRYLVDEKHIKEHGASTVFLVSCAGGLVDKVEYKGVRMVSEHDSKASIDVGIEFDGQDSIVSWSPVSREAYGLRDAWDAQKVKSVEAEMEGSLLDALERIVQNPGGVLRGVAQSVGVSLYSAGGQWRLL